MEGINDDDDKRIIIKIALTVRECHNNRESEYTFMFLKSGNCSLLLRIQLSLFGSNH
jgi:hypothetical protein